MSGAGDRLNRPAPEGVSEAVAAHMRRIRVLRRPGGPLSQAGASATVKNPAWFAAAAGAPEPTAVRRAMHRELVAAVAPDESIGRGRRAIVMAGPPGAGKSTIRVPFMQAAGLDPASFAVIDADRFKDGLIEVALADGSYQDWIKPAAVRELEATGERFFPLEMSALLQRESGLLALQQRQEAVAAGADIVIDTVLWDRAGALALGRELAEAGYTITVLDVEVPASLAQARIQARWEQAYREALAGGASAGGGRWVPSEYVRMVFAGPGGAPGRSRCEVAAADLARACPAVTRYQLHRTAVPRGQAMPPAPVVEVDLARSGVGEPLLPRGDSSTGRRPGIGPGPAHRR